MNPNAGTFAEIIAATHDRLGRNIRIRRNLPGGGRVRIDRQLPFLCLYREPVDHDDIGTRDLVTTEAAYLFASGEAKYHEPLVDLCQAINKTIQEHFGAFLLVEIWAGEAALASFAPGFRIVAPEAAAIPTTVSVLQKSLADVHLHGQSAEVTLVTDDTVAPPNMPSLSLNCVPEGGGCFHFGIEVRPVYRGAGNNGDAAFYPLVAQALRRQFSIALRKAIFAFTSREKDEPTGHYESLGPTSMVKAARFVDEQLCEVSDAFDFLLQVTPTNAEHAWLDFSESNFQQEPHFHYRPLPYRPSALKRKLFAIEIERIEDATLAHLFWEKQDELDRQITALKDLNTSNFLLSSRQLYGHADDELVALAEEVLRNIPADGSRAEVPCADTAEIVAQAREHLAFYHQQLDEFDAEIEVCDHIAAGLMVAKDRLYISDRISLRVDRLDALLHHEIGTHLLTYFNGRQQPFRQLYAGLAGYEALQEGLAVLAEYLVDGLTANRLRTLAARVIAVRAMCDGATFCETFGKLHLDHQFTPRRAFTTTLRVFRGGGLTKDIIYLRGLRDLLDYLRQGHDVEPLYVGKIALHHVPYVQELRRRGIIQPPALLPRFWNNDAQQQRLENCRELSLPQLVRNKQ